MKSFSSGEFSDSLVLKCLRIRMLMYTLVSFYLLGYGLQCIFANGKVYTTITLLPYQVAVGTALVVAAILEVFVTTVATNVHFHNWQPKTPLSLTKCTSPAYSFFLIVSAATVATLWHGHSTKAAGFMILSLACATYILIKEMLTPSNFSSQPDHIE
jgi:hypothetical protein